MKLFNVRIRAKNVMITFLATDFSGQLSYNALTAEIPSKLEMFAYNDFTSIVTNRQLAGIFFAVSILFKKPFESCT